jgi:hypothetical protein
MNELVVTTVQIAWGEPCQQRGFLLGYDVHECPHNADLTKQHNTRSIDWVGAQQ